MLVKGPRKRSVYGEREQTSKMESDENEVEKRRNKDGEIYLSGDSVAALCCGPR